MTDQMKSVPHRELCEHWGLDARVFAAVEARLEHRLDTVMMRPAWYFDVRGNVDDTDFLMVVGARGAGKSALRRLITEQATHDVLTSDFGGRILVVTIDKDVSGWVAEGGQSIHHFLRAVVELLTVALTSYCDRESLRVLAPEQVRQLDRLLTSLEHLPPESVDTLREKTLSWSGKLDRAVNSRPVQVAIEAVRAVQGGDAAAQPTTAEVSRASDSTRRDLASLLSTTKTLGFDCIYLMCDEFDEYAVTQDDAERAAELAVPIATDLSLREQDGLALKMFLSEPVFGAVEDLCRRTSRSLRWDRTRHRRPYRLEWSQAEIQAMLETRLRTYTLPDRSPVTSLAPLCVGDLSDRIDQEIAHYAYRSPRYFILFANGLLARAARHALATGYRITEELFAAELVEFCKYSCEELYGSRAVNTWLQFGREEFRQSELANDLELENQEAERLLSDLSRPRGALRTASYSGQGDNFHIADPKLLHLLRCERERPGSGVIIA